MSPFKLQAARHEAPEAQPRYVAAAFLSSFYRYPPGSVACLNNFFFSYTFPTLFSLP